MLQYEADSVLEEIQVLSINAERVNITQIITKKCALSYVTSSCLAITSNI